MTISSITLKGKILYLDDREHNLVSFKATFRREYEVYTASNSHNAFDLIQTHNIQVVVADFKMPDISGVTFLEQVKFRFPDTIRIMLTGHADLPAVVESINRSEIFRFLAKPWKEDELRKAFDSALQIYSTKKELEEKNAELKKAYVELDRLVYSTAHDITSPLSNILGLVNLIRMDGIKDGEYLNLIETTAKRLQFLARDVLSFHRNKRSELQPKKINLQTLAEKSISDIAYFDNFSSVSLKLNVEQNVDFYSDKSRWRIILNNLLSNAIKYQDPLKSDKYISVDISANSKEAILAVEDNGVGISDELLPKIFDLYFRASKMSTGSGIGLYIVSEAVSLLKGTIETQSTEGKGTRFSISIPNIAPSKP